MKMKKIMIIIAIVVLNALGSIGCTDTQNNDLNKPEIESVDNWK